MHVNLLGTFKDVFVSSIKAVLFRKLVRKQPVIIKDVQTNLLKDKYALVTGGNSGIGLAIAKKMLDSGAHVTIVAHNLEKTKCIAEELNCDYLLINLADTEELIEKVSAYLKNNKIDILVNSAGMRDKEPWLAKTPKAFDQVMNLNLK